MSLFRSIIRTLLSKSNTTVESFDIKDVKPFISEDIEISVAKMGSKLSIRLMS